MVAPRRWCNHLPTMLASLDPGNSARTAAVAMMSLAVVAGCDRPAPDSGDRGQRRRPASNERAYHPAPAVDGVSREEGRVVLLGRAPPGSIVRLATPEGRGVSTPAGAGGGRWRIDLTPSSEMRLFGLSTVDGGRVVQSEGYLAVAPDLAAQLRAGAGAVVYGATEGGPRILAIDYDSKGGCVVSGVAGSGRPVSVRIDGAQRGQARADPTGRFSLALEEPVSFGSRTFEVVDGERRTNVCGRDYARRADAGDPAPRDPSRGRLAHRLDHAGRRPPDHRAVPAAAAVRRRSRVSFTHPATRHTAAPITPAPTTRFSFWSSMADLVRLVLRSKAKGLKSRLGVALALVLIGKWTGVIGPLLISSAIDKLNVGKHGAGPVFTAFAGLAIGWVLLRFVAGVTPYLREAIFTPVSQMALARSAMETFGHALSLSLNFHQGKQTGGLARLIDRGARSTDYLLRSVVFNLGPTLLELMMAAYVLTSRFNWRLALVAIATIVVYIAFTFSHLELADQAPPDNERRRLQRRRLGRRRADELRDDQDLRRRGPGWWRSTTGRIAAATRAPRCRPTPRSNC